MGSTPLAAHATAPEYSPQSVQGAPASANPSRTLGDARAKLSIGDYKGAEVDLRAFLGSPDIDRAPPRLRFAAYLGLSICQNANGESQGVYESVSRAGDVAPELRNFEYWQMLMAAAVTTGHNYVAAEALSAALRADPVKAQRIDIGLMWTIMDATHEMNDGGYHRHLLQAALWQAAYRPDDAAQRAGLQSFWAELFEYDVDHGETAQAQSYLTAIVDPYQIVRLRADNRYRQALPGDSRYADNDVMNRGYLDYLRRQAADQPRSIAARQLLAEALRNSGAPVESLAVIDASIEKINRAPADRPPFDDLTDNLRWMLDARAKALSRLGRWNEALSAAQAARDEANRQKKDLASQTINLGEMLNRLDRPREALRAVRGLDQNTASEYGMTEFAQVKVCAYAQMGEKAKARAAVDALLVNSNLDPESVRSALLCIDDEDRLAQVIVGRLDDPLTRNYELAADQAYAPTPNPTPFLATMAHRLNTVLHRPDVRAALSRYGVVESYPLTSPDYGVW
ncbi:hypothetical protein LFL96_33350 [Paraburkholderia sp. D15]|uniref:hypothetical protein n=1 Tax=Paraburkholderia sp. D15 TaxID=2880218 RepID=UPI00247AF883|nr:hypothetical protein [Paraburkholderia sp. D15]WGS53059.1 hypothetical protein LFL96_33350 [Paraburkholderia sp. D15]